MITPGYLRIFAAYNIEMNRRLYDASARLSDAERRMDRGAFWQSIHGTLNHLLWGDQQWMSRFAGWPKNTRPLKDSCRLHDDFGALRVAREDADLRIADWTGSVTEAWLAEDMVWFSGAQQKEMRKPHALLMMHFFNHQTHHRGQVHAMLTAAGQQTGDTDLAFILPD